MAPKKAPVEEPEEPVEPEPVEARVEALRWLSPRRLKAFHGF